MSTRVQLSDGRVVTVETDDPDEAARAAHRFQQANPDPRGNPAYQRRARERTTQAQPGTALRALQDFNRNGPAGMMNQMWRNVGIADDVAHWSERLLHGGDNAAGNAAAQFERDQQERVSREQPALNAASIAASVPAMGGNPVAQAGRIGALRAGGAAAAVNAPFALARQEGSLEERLPGAALETAAVGAFGAGLQGLSNRLAQPAMLRGGRQRAADFEAAGVRPTQAAISGGAPAGLTKMISENFVAGGGARRNLAASIDDTAQAARRLSERAGQAGEPEQIGEMLRRGVQRFAREERPRPPGAPRDPRRIPVRDWGFRAKASALYDEVFGWINADEAGHLAGQTGARASAEATRRVAQEIEARVGAPNLAELVNDPTVSRIARALEGDADQIRFNDLRALRTWVRTQRERPGLTQSVDAASLARLESALTEDIYLSAMDLGGVEAARQLRTVDRWYRRVINRIDEVLQPFQDSTGRGAYDRVVSLARDGSRQNVRALERLRASLRPDEWNSVAATVIDRLGRPTSGAANALEEGAFSVETFVTNYAKLSPDGRRALFGDSELGQALETLARVAGYQKGVERMVNASRSGVNMLNFGSLAGLANPETTFPTAGLLAGMSVTGEMLTNPAFVRWLASAPRVGGGVQGMRRHLGALAQIAARDPAVAPLYAELTRRGLEQVRPQDDRPAPRSGPSQSYRERAL